MPGNPSGVIGMTSYNRRILDIIKEYDNKDVLNQPQFVNMLGGTRLRKFIDSGDTSYDNEAVFGGRANKVKKTGLAKALRTFGRAVKPLGKTIKPIKKALVEKVVQQIDGFDGRKAQNITPGVPVAEAYEVNDLGLPPLPMKGGKKKRGLAKFLKTVGQFVKPLNKELQPLKDALVKKGVATIEAGKKPKSARGALVSKIMKEKKMKLGEASKYVKEHKLF